MPKPACFTRLAASAYFSMVSRMTSSGISGIFTPWSRAPALVPSPMRATGA